MKSIFRPKKFTFNARLRRIALVLIAALLIGGALYTAAWYVRDYTFIGDVADQSRDTAFALRADIERPRHLGAPLVFVTIENETYAALGRSEVVPASALKRLLQTVADSKPRMIVLDIDISGRRDPNDVVQLSEALSHAAAGRVPLLLVRTTPPRGSDDAPAILQPTPYDGIISANRNITWVSGEALVSQGITRDISSWVLTCSGMKPGYLMGIGPVASLVYYGNLSPNAAAGAVQPAPDWKCTDMGTPSITPHAMRLPGPAGMSVLNNDHDRQVHYTLRWHGSDWSSSQTVTAVQGGKWPLLTVLPAGLLLGNRAGESTDLLHGAVVVLGASNTASGDLQDTPLGDMPGAMVLLNHIRGFLDFGPQDRDPFLPGLFIMLGMSFVTGIFVLLFSSWTSSWGGIVLPLLFTLMWWGASALLLGGTGYFALSLVQFFVGIATALLYPKELNGGKP